MKKNPFTQSFEEAVFPAELEEINQGRKARGLPSCDKDGTPSSGKGLTGLSLSGGGIRSATICLGVLQGLIRKGVFKRVDYLSTVSGGGYLGSCVSSLLRDKQASAKDFLDTKGANESPVINHLRSSGDYLSSGSLMEQVRLPMVVLRGLILNMLPLLACLIGAVFLTEVFMELWHMAGAVTIHPLYFSCLFLAPVLIYPLLFRLGRRFFNWKGRNFYELFLSASLALTLAIMAAVPILSLVRFCVDKTWEGQIRRLLHTQPMGQEYLQIMLVIVLLMAFGILGLYLTKLSKVTKTILGLLIAILGPAGTFGAYLFLCVFFIESPYFARGFEAVLNGDESSYTPLYDKESFTTLLRGKGFRFRHDPSMNPWSVRKTGTAEAPRWTISYVDLHRGSRNIEIRRTYGYLFIPKWSILDGNAVWPFYLTGLGIFLYAFFFMDVNVTSLHGFYRDRLSKAYLLRRAPNQRLEPNDEQKLSELNQEDGTAPYHLINATLNIGETIDSNLRGRHADFFVFSKRFSGSRSTGYAETTEFEKRDSHLNTGTAMAISAAAVSPNAGRITNRYYVFMLTLFNIRLGYWTPNPARMGSGVLLRRLIRPYVGPSYLLREALSLLNEGTACLNLSDGGHLENLGLYQLLKRRCRLIIAVDAEADPHLRFPSLVELIRLARIDLGVHIDIDLANLRLHSDHRSRKHWTLARIHYGTGEEPGYLLYIKSSLTGDENEYIKAYKNSVPSFPHESTSDQFFTETQFEVYRALGEHMAMEALDENPSLMDKATGDKHPNTGDVTA